MKLKHFEVHVHYSDPQFLGSWRACQTDDIDRGIGESEIPLGKKLTIQKLEDFCLNSIHQANMIFLQSTPG